MAKIKRVSHVGYTAQQMYHLVNDVDSYPEFIPGCADAKIIQQNAHEMIARLDVAKAGIHKTFTTRNTLTPNHSVLIELVDGPFKHLGGLWQFTDTGERQSRIEFELDFEFKSKMIAFAFGAIFGELMASMVQAFIQRAHEVYRD